MSPDPTAARNEVLSKIIDVVQEVEQDRKVPQTHALHAGLDRLGHHMAAALAEQDDTGSRAALADVQRGLVARRQTFGA